MKHRYFENEQVGKPYNATIAFEAPWAHPLWSQYIIQLYDLTTPWQWPATLLRDGMTHEFMLWAVNPEQPIPDSFPAQLQPGPGLLSPINHGYQFPAATNLQAFGRILELVQRIEARTLSPDTDFIGVWDSLFRDGISLRVSA